jgi:glycosyltransferase involved in cell wall biosynthesis
MLARFIADRPVFVTVYAAMHQMRWPAYYQFGLVAPLVSKLITVLPVSRAELRSVGVSDHKICFVPMGLDFAGSNPDRHDEVRLELAATYGFDPQRPLLLSVARLARDRHIHLLVDAMTAISQARPDALLLMIGDGNQRADLERMVDQRGLQRNIIFGKPRTDVWNVMPGCDVYMTMAAGHGHGVAALQAMACARPVAAYSMSPMLCEQALQTGQGMFIAARDAHALARVVCELLDDREKSSALGFKARKRVIECASLRTMIAGYEDLYAAYAHQPDRKPYARQSGPG